MSHNDISSLHLICESCSQDIQFDIERSQLALAANLATLHRMLLRVMSQKLSEKLVFPNCQGISFSSVDLLDVRHPPAEGLLSLNIQIRLNTPGDCSQLLHAARNMCS
jgi:hypothetical protein